MSSIRIAGSTFTIDHATFEAYHCASEAADWNLRLTRADETLWLAGTISPGPRTPDTLVGATVRIDLRALDELAAALLGRAVTLYPNGEAVCELRFPLTATATGIRFQAACTCEWDRYLESFDAPDPIELALDIEAEVAALHPGALPPYGTQ